MQILLSSKERIVTRSLVISFFLLLTYTVISLFSPSESVFAAWNITDKTQQINVYLRPSIGISILDSTATSTISDLTFNMVPSASGTFQKQSAVAHVYTTNPTGYTLYISSDYKTHTNAYTNRLINTNTAIDDSTDSSIGAIPTLASDNVAESAFSAANSAHKNRWGYSRVWNETVSSNVYSGGSAATYRPVPNHGSQAIVRNDVTRAISSSNTTVGIGVNIDTSKASGTYKNKIVLTALANAE